MKLMLQSTRSGFTIVELLIIVATLAVLALIAVFGYNGIQNRAQLHVMRSEMLAFAKSAAIFQQITGELPVSEADFVYVLKEARLYDKTRTPDKNFAICASNAGYALVAWNPFVGSVKRGSTLYLYQDFSGQAMHTLTNSSLESQLQLAKICDQVYDDSTYEVWTHNLP